MKLPPPPTGGRRAGGRTRRPRPGLHAPTLGLWLFAGLALAPAAAVGAEPASGREIYQQYCSVCHGEQGDGQSRARFGLDPPPADFTVPHLAGTLSSTEMIQVVAHGKPGTAMAAWDSRLSREEIRRVVEYVREAFMQSGMEPAHGQAEQAPPPGHEGHDHSHSGEMSGLLHAEFPHGLEGNVDAGRRLYLQNCVACHGLEGDGDGPRADFIIPKPRDFSTGVPMGRPQLLQSIRNGVRGREMPAWGKVMTDQQLADVAEFVFVRFQRPRIRRALAAD